MVGDAAGAAKKQLVDLLINYGRCLEALNRNRQALSVYQQGIGLDRFEEIFYQRLIDNCRRLGRYAEAVRHYHTCCRLLEEELGVPPSEETQRLYRKVCAAATIREADGARK